MEQQGGHTKCLSNYLSVFNQFLLQARGSSLAPRLTLQKKCYTSKVPLAHVNESAFCQAELSEPNGESDLFVYSPNIRWANPNKTMNPGR
jgi:hypothetical protein